MEINWKQNMNEVGGAFLLSWAVFGLGTGIEFAVALAVAWMAFKGAHLLPVVTWSHMMTSDLSDAEGNWMENGMRLISQVIGALLAIILMTEGDGDYTATDMWITDIADQYWMAIAMIAAGAVWWQIHTRCESEWASGISMMALVGAMTITGAHSMGAHLGSMEFAGIADTLVNWIVNGALVGIGALIGVKIDDMIPSGEAEASAE
tara:strand:+ start:531 stop:1148 length:618 start_codon:yes stop_codon:yes gene_type:complete